MEETERRLREALDRMPPEHRAHGKRWMEAEMRIERGVGVRFIYVSHGDKAMAVPISDELVVEARYGLDAAVKWERENGLPAYTPAEHCMIGLKALGDIADAQSVDDRMKWGFAKSAVCRLYDEVVLRRHRPWDGERIYWSELIGGDPDVLPPDEYWLVLADDCRTFQLLAMEPDVFPIIDEAHLGTRH